ncbi:beta-N-acetylhexosaminidase [Rhodovulum iodosum]|uniref:beta-N-acetylhexosaminidase n=1 Tax=Rhodovulum iodosum TaxID=68291 RepID=A0ABV3XVL2_9RHOB|nr:beta-N-acetylhexosaminidase [Rhodovulum robiginosum]RSK33446.1 beta-N-acetylhexosaminidase [Rhodovulum robiginosum]
MTEGAGAFFSGCAGPVLSEAERRFFAEARPLGFILFDRNIEDPGQLRALTGALREAVGRDAPILIDQEGGRVQRMKPPYWRQWRPALEQMQSADPGRAARAMFLRSRLIAEELRAVGIDVNCAPVADLARRDTHPVLKNRCYGSDAVTVIGAARAVAEGLLAGGVLPVLKHIPGHGRGTLDSHMTLPRVSADRATLEAEDFAPFRALADLPMAMTAHIVYDAIDPDRAATVSPQAIGVIRDEIGFDGLLMSDDISMQALSGDMKRRTVAALRAGCDAVLHCNGDMAEMEAVAEEAGMLSEAGALRAAAALARRRPPAPAQAEALEAELAEILKGDVYG